MSADDNRREALRVTAMHIVLEVRRKHLTHTEYLDMRTMLLFRHAAWDKVPHYVQRQTTAFLDGAMWLLEREHIEWYHDIDGIYYARHTYQGDHSKIDVNKSHFRWKEDTSKVWI